MTKHQKKYVCGWIWSKDTWPSTLYTLSHTFVTVTNVSLTCSKKIVNELHPFVQWGASRQSFEYNELLYLSFFVPFDFVPGLSSRPVRARQQDAHQTIFDEKRTVMLNTPRKSCHFCQVQESQIVDMCHFVFFLTFLFCFLGDVEGMKELKTLFLGHSLHCLTAV